MSQIVLDGVTKVYSGDVRAVSDTTLTIPSGEFMVLVGPSGCGKSTLLRMIAGLETVSAGDILVGGRRVTDTPPRERNLSMVFQSYALYPHLSEFENIAFPLRIRRVPEEDVRRRVGEVAAKAVFGRRIFQCVHMAQGLCHVIVAWGNAGDAPDYSDEGPSAFPAA